MTGCTNNDHTLTGVWKSANWYFRYYVQTVYIYIHIAYTQSKIQHQANTIDTHTHTHIHVHILNYIYNFDIHKSFKTYVCIDLVAISYVLHRLVMYSYNWLS